MAKPELQVMTANRLSDGAVIYLDGENNWVEDLEGAAITRTEAEVEKLTSLAEDAVRNRVVVGPYLFAVEPRDARFIPVSQREHIRALGPTAGTDRTDTLSQHSQGGA